MLPSLSLSLFYPAPARQPALVPSPREKLTTRCDTISLPLPTHHALFAFQLVYNHNHSVASCRRYLHPIALYPSVDSFDIFIDFASSSPRDPSGAFGSLPASVSEGRGLRRLPVIIPQETHHFLRLSSIIPYTLTAHNSRQNVDAIRSLLRHQEVPGPAVLSRPVANAPTIERQHQR